MSNYVATVVKIPMIQPIEGADKIGLVQILGENIIVSKDSDLSATYLLFLSGTQLAPEYLKANNLYQKSENNADVTKKGYFSDKGVVSSVKLKGIISTAFLMPISSLESIVNTSKLKIGDEFEEIAGFKLCWKYEKPVKLHVHGTGNPVKKEFKLSDLIVKGQFKFHDETESFARNLHKFKENDIVVILRKKHGSSCILSHVLVNNKLSWFQKKWNKIPFLPSFKTVDYGYLWSSGKPKSRLVKGISTGWMNPNESYYSQNIWKTAFDDYKHTLEKGISIYSELVASNIQKGYNYGHPEGTYGMYVYRITKTDEFSNTVEFSWQQIKDYCKKYNLLHVEEYYHGRYGDITSSNILKYLTDKYLGKKCLDCINKNLPDEGIVIRFDGNLNAFNAFKLKDKNFILKETQQLEDDTIVNEES